MWRASHKLQKQTHKEERPEDARLQGDAAPEKHQSSVISDSLKTIGSQRPCVRRSMALQFVPSWDQLRYWRQRTVLRFPNEHVLHCSDRRTKWLIKLWLQIVLRAFVGDCKDAPLFLNARAISSMRLRHLPTTERVLPSAALLMAESSIDKYVT